ncbi:DKNYY family protein [Aliiroseovarius sediminilitoris]|uniref:DKNYY family protein n=1 Tax=Aliiroseovarius sediminilitoris TaxID=1173584 RepID=A0A1I0MHB7_9RHOB|nr:DKNYY domain-containing protein [Aliiroseovarius sediminilitoris]SEV87709.1 DKNYY family protein [Aliiroseovarius sediminilitoris]
MAEPAGLLFECPLNEKLLAALFKQEITLDDRKVQFGRALSELLGSGDDADVLIVHHDPDQERLFLAWMLNFYDKSALAPIWPILDALAANIDPSADAGGAVATIFPEALESVRVQDGTVVRGPGDLVDADLLKRLSDKLWDFAKKEQFPDAAASMRRKTTQCKPFKTAWKSYLAWREKEERPARIAAATAQEPFLLFDDVYTAQGQVFQRHNHTKRDIEFAGADPLTFRKESRYHADKNHVWHRQLADGSPPARDPKGAYPRNNRDAIWEYVHVEGADGASFRWLFDRWDTIYWRDRHRVYSSSSALALVPLPGVDATKFREIGNGYGTDGQQVYWGLDRLPLDATKLQTNDIFIWDPDKVFCLGQELPLKGAGFRILTQKFQRPAIQYAYRLTDGKKTIVLSPQKEILPDDPDF